MEPAQELSADRRPIDNRHPPNRRVEMASSPDRYVERHERGREIITGEFRAYPWMVASRPAPTRTR
jgi:hypothetical protein